MPDPRYVNTFYTALQAAGLPDVPAEFSVVPQHQIIPAAILAEIPDFIRVFRSRRQPLELAGGSLARCAGARSRPKRGGQKIPRKIVAGQQ
jgi:hypothetical protein